MIQHRHIVSVIQKFQCTIDANNAAANDNNLRHFSSL